MTRPDPSIYALPLGQAAFEDAVRRGLGRAHLHAQQHGIGNQGHFLLGACLRNDVYDPQCEASRAPYLIQLARTVGLEAELHDRLLAADPEPESDNAWQVEAFHRQLAKEGYDPSREWLYKRVEGSTRPLCGHDLFDLIELDGFSGALRVVQNVGDRWEFGADAYNVVRNVAKHTDLSLDEVIERFDAHSHEMNVSAFLGLVRRHKDQQAAPGVSHIDPVGRSMQEVVEQIGLRCKPFRLSVAKAIRNATEDQLEALGRETRTVARTNPELANQLVRGVPRDRIPPSVVDFHLDRVRAHPPTTEGRKQAGVFSWQSALRLGHVADPRIEPLALDVYEAGYEVAAIAMLSSVYRSQHEPLLWKTIESAENIYALHSALDAVIDIFHERDNPSPRRDLLLHAYAYTQCTNCRARAVEALRATGELPAHIEAERPFDAEAVGWDDPQTPTPAS